MGLGVALQGLSTCRHSISPSPADETLRKEACSNGVWDSAVVDGIPPIEGSGAHRT